MIPFMAIYFIVMTRTIGPQMILVAIPLLVVIGTSSATNDYGQDGPSNWLHMVSGIRSADLVLGRHLHKQHEADAEKRTKTNLVIEAIAKAEGFEASPEEVEKEIAELAATYNMEVEQVKNLLSADMLQHDIAVKKAVELVTSTASVK